MMNFGAVADGHGPLSEITVLELGSMLAGPFVGTMMADFGATVIKAEKPGVPDQIREWPPHKNEVSLWWKLIARNKHPITLDISKPLGREIALELMQRCDVVIENFRPGTMERWSLDPAELRHQFPRIVWVRVSGWGQTGPYADQGGFATIAEAFSGLASFTGLPEGSPMISAFPLGDFLAGIFGAFGALSAIVAREKSGKGQIIDVSLFEPFMRVIESAFLRFDQTSELKPRMGNQMEEDVPRNIYQTRDGRHIAVSCGAQRTFEGLADAMQLPALKTDPRFISMNDRVANRAEIDGIVTRWALTVDAETALAALRQHAVVAGPVNTIEDVLKDPHVLARKIIREVKDADLGTLKMINPVPNLSDTPGSLRWAGRRAGDANDYVLRDLLGRSAKDIEILKEQRVI